MAIRIDYIELSAPNVAKAKAFYGAAFGWKFTDYGDDYAGIQGDGKEDGGIKQGAEGPLVILRSDALEQTRDAVKAAGGIIVKDIFSFPGGRRFHFTDPSGHELAVWSPT